MHISKINVVFLSLTLLFIGIKANAQSQREIAALLKEGRYLQAAKELRPLADNGVAWAQAMASWLFFEGKGVQKNEQQGVKYATLGANQGNEDALGCLLNYYEKKGERAKVMSTAKEYTDKFPHLLKSQIGWILGERYVYNENKENEDEGWRILTDHPNFIETLNNNEYFAQAYWGYQMRKGGYNDGMQYLDYLYGKNNNKDFNNFLAFYEKVKGGHESAMSFYTAQSNNGNAIACAILTWYEMEKNPGRYVNVSTIKSMSAKARGSKMGDQIYAEWGNLPCTGDKEGGGTIYSINYGTRTKYIISDMINCKKKDIYTTINRMNSSTGLNWRLPRVDEMEYLRANSSKTGVTVTLWGYVWLVDGTYKPSYNSANMLKSNENITPTTSGMMILIAEKQY